MAARASAEPTNPVTKSGAKPANEQRELETGSQGAVTQEKPEVHVEERIRQRAYEIYLQRGESDATALDDWIQAETEIVHTVDQNFIDLDKADLAAPGELAASDKLAAPDKPAASEKPAASQK